MQGSDAVLAEAHTSFLHHPLHLTILGISDAGRCRTWQNPPANPFAWFRDVLLSDVWVPLPVGAQKGSEGTVKETCITTTVQGHRNESYP